MSQLGTRSEILEGMAKGVDFTNMTMQEMKNIDVRDINPDTVVDYTKITVKTDLPKFERMVDVTNQMGGNPYFIKVGKILVKMSYMETDISIDKRWEEHLRTI